MAGTLLPIVVAGVPDVVHLTGAEEVTGQKTFTAPLATADPTVALGLSTKQYVDNTIASTSVAKAGDTMTGDLVLNANPSLALGAATKQYVDGSVRQQSSTAQAQAGVDTTTDMSPARVAEAITALAPATVGLGDGQTWQDMSASRAVSTTYTNTTGRSIFVSIDSSWTGTLVVNGATIANNVGGNSRYPTTFIVPSGNTYSFSGASYTAWTELR